MALLIRSPKSQPRSGRNKLSVERKTRESVSVHRGSISNQTQNARRQWGYHDGKLLTGITKQFQAYKGKRNKKYVNLKSLNFKLSLVWPHPHSVYAYMQYYDQILTWRRVVILLLAFKIQLHWIFGFWLEVTPTWLQVTHIRQYVVIICQWELFIIARIQLEILTSCRLSPYCTYVNASGPCASSCEFVAKCFCKTDQRV